MRADKARTARHQDALFKMHGKTTSPLTVGLYLMRALAASKCAVTSEKLDCLVYVTSVHDTENSNLTTKRIARSLPARECA